MLIQEIMTPDPMTVGPQDTLRTAIEKMALVGCRRLPVMAEGQLVGIVADMDVREALNSPIILRDEQRGICLTGGVSRCSVRACLRR